MTKPLDKFTRKALVRLAEQNPDYRVMARVVLGIDAGRSDDQIAKSARTTDNEVRNLRLRFEHEALAMFVGVLPEEITGVASLTHSEEAESEVEEQGAPPEVFVVAEAYEPEDEILDDPPQLTEQRPEATETTEITEDQPVDELEEDLQLVLQNDPALTPIVDNEPLPEPSTMPPQQEEPESDLPASAPNPETPLSIGALAAAFDVDMRRARHISQLARELFDITSNYHRLPAHFRDLLHAASLLHDIAHELDPDNAPAVGGEIIQQYSFYELSIEERQLLSALVALQKPGTTPRTDVMFTALEDSMYQSAEMLLALFRVALGLDRSEAQTTAILEWHEVPGEIDIVLIGRDVETDATGAQYNSELWNAQYGLPQLRFMTQDAAAADEAVEDLPLLPTLSDHDLSVDASNRLREHYAMRFDYLARRILRNDSGLLVPLWREFQRLTGVWLWLLPGSKPRQVFAEDTDWLATLIQNGLFYATVEDRIEALLDQTDPERDDPSGLHGLKTLLVHHSQQSAAAFEQLRNAFRSRRYQRWLTSVRNPLRGAEDTTTFASQIGVRAWAYLGELRHLIDSVNAAGMNADLSELLTLEVMASFELDLRLLTDLMTYSASLLGTEVEQVLQVLEPISSYVQAWQRIEGAANYAEDAFKRGAFSQDVQGFVLEALATLLRERADEMRWGLADMWEPLETRTFRRALALAIARP